MESIICKFGIAMTTAILSMTLQTTEVKDTYLSEEIQEYCIQYGEQYGICPELLMAIIERESSGEQYAENGNCKGLMQINIKWHTDRMERLEVTDIYDVESNILLGADYIAELARKYSDVAIVLAKYHGERNAETKKTISKYVQGILDRSAELERAHGK